MRRNHLRNRRVPTMVPRTAFSIGLFAILMVGGGAVAMAHGSPHGPEEVGICHATGSTENPYVFIVVDRDGAEHGHHKQHAGDRFDVESEADCGPGPGVAESESTGTCGFPMESDNAQPAAEPEAPAADDAGDEEEAPEDAADDAAQTPSNETEATEEAETTNESADNAEESAVCAADVSVASQGALEGGRAVFHLLVTSHGPDEADAVHLSDELPDVGGPWQLGGADASGCTLDVRQLECSFGDLVSGEVRTVWAAAPRCPHDCGEDLEDDASVTAFNDGNETNNAASATIVIPECGQEAPEESPEAPPADNETAPPPADNGTGNESEPADTPPPTDEPADETGNESDDDDTPPADNETEDVPENESEPEPEEADMAVRQTSTQDDERVVLSLLVRNLGPDTAHSVVLADALPDVRRAWFLGGDDAPDCTLEGRTLRCEFGDIAPGESRSVSLQAFVDRLPCGEHKSNTAIVTSSADANPTNDRSSASILARAC